MPDSVWAAAASLLACVLLAPAVHAQGAAQQPGARIGIIIDDMGYGRSDGLRAIALPGPLTYAFLPHTPYAARLARLAHRLDKEVLVHVPMTADDHRRLGPGALEQGMSERALLATMRSDLASIPFASGVSNHMGSLLTARPRPMRWLMQALRGHGHLYFVDSRTTPATVALEMARRSGVPGISRDVFLDNERRPEAILGQFERLAAKAREHGAALGIGHPHPETLRVLAAVLPRLKQYGVELVPVSALLPAPQPAPARPRLSLSAAAPASP